MNYNYWDTKDRDPEEAERARTDTWSKESANTCLLPNPCKCNKCKAHVKSKQRFFKRRKK